MAHLYIQGSRARQLHPVGPVPLVRGARTLPRGLRPGARPRGRDSGKHLCGLWPMTAALRRGITRAVRLWVMMVTAYLGTIGLAHLWLTFLPAYSEGMMLPAFW